MSSSGVRSPIVAKLLGTRRQDGRSMGLREKDSKRPNGDGEKEEHPQCPETMETSNISMRQSTLCGSNVLRTGVCNDKKSDDECHTRSRQYGSSAVEIPVKTARRELGSTTRTTTIWLATSQP